MGGRRAVGGPGTAVLLCIALVVLTLTAAGPAAATPVDLFNTVPTGWAISGPGGTPGTHYCSTAATDCDNAFDANDATLSYHSMDGGDGCANDGVGSDCYWNGRFVRTSGVTSFTIGAFRFKYDTVTTCCGGPANRGYYLKVNPEGGGSTQTCYSSAATMASSGDISLSCTTPVTIVTGDHFELHVLGVWSGGTRTRIYSFEAYSSLVTETPIEFYCHNARVDHPQFRWTMECWWNYDWTGTLTITADPAGAFYVNEPTLYADAGVSHNPSVSYTPGGGFQAGDPLKIHQDCFPLCQSDHITIDINDTGRSQHASFTFDRSDNGAIQLPIAPPHFTAWVGCFNVTANQCDDGLDVGHAHSSGAGTVDISFCFEGGGETGLNNPVHVVVGQRSNTDPSQFNSTPYDETDVAPGCYQAWGLADANPTGHTVWMFYASSVAGASVRTVTLNVATGGELAAGTSSANPEPDVVADCGFLQGFCDLFNIGKNAVTNKIREAMGGEPDAPYNDGLIDALLARQPFNFIARSLSGVGSQLTRATGAMSATTDCPGLHIEVPWSAWMPEAYRPTGAPLEFYLLRCADFEPFVATSWYQAIRTAMDPALYLAYGYVWVKRLQPRPVMSG